MSSAVCFNLGQSRILSSGNELIYHFVGGRSTRGRHKVCSGVFGGVFLGQKNAIFCILSCIRFRDLSSFTSESDFQRNYEGIDITHLFANII